MAEATRYQRLSELFYSTYELSREERERIIDGLEPDDADLAAELRSLLDAHDAGGAAVESAWARVEDQMAAEGADAAMEGRSIGPYRILELLGRGGMGAVFLATRADDAFERKVAVKVVYAPSASPDLVRRFHRERRTLARLEHPSIARLYDAGTTDEGLPFFVMELVDGVPIDRWCDDRGLNVETRLDVFRQVCAAIEAAHRNLVIHLDIKPSNILVTADGTPKLLDFGISRPLQEEGAAEVAPTLAVGAAMTPDYASPEQVTNRPVTTASDVYSLGVLLYRLLAGRQPYKTRGLALTEVGRVVCEQEPPPPSQVAPIESRRRLRGDLDLIVLKALSKDPAARYPSVEALATDLRRHLGGLPVDARRPTLRYHAARFVARHRLGVTAAVLSILLLIAGVVAFAHQARVAAAERDRARTEAAKAEQIKRFLVEMLSSADPMVGGRELTVARALESAGERAAAELGEMPGVEVAIRSTLATTYRNLGLHEEAEREARAALELASAPGARDGASVETARIELGLVLQQAGKYEEAEALLRAAATSLRAAGNRAVELAVALDGLGLTLKTGGRPEEGEPFYREAVELYRRHLPDDPRLGRALNNLGVLLGERGDLVEAEALHREALEILRGSLGPGHPDTAEALAGLGGVVDAQGRLAEAEPLMKEAVGLLTPLLGERHPRVVLTQTGLAYNLVLQGRYREAAAEASIALERARLGLPAGHPLIAYAHLTLGQALCEGDSPAEGESHLRRALALREAVMPANHWVLGNTRSVLGGCLTRQGRYAEAEPLLSASYEALRAALGDGHEKTLAAAERLRELERISRAGS